MKPLLFFLFFGLQPCDNLIKHMSNTSNTQGAMAAAEIKHLILMIFRRLWLWLSDNMGLEGSLDRHPCQNASSVISVWICVCGEKHVHPLPPVYEWV